MRSRGFVISDVRGPCNNKDKVHGAILMQISDDAIRGGASSASIHDSRLFIQHECCFAGDLLSAQKFPPICILPRVGFSHFRILAGGTSIFRFSREI